MNESVLTFGQARVDEFGECVNVGGESRFRHVGHNRHTGFVERKGKREKGKGLRKEITWRRARIVRSIKVLHARAGVEQRAVGRMRHGQAQPLHVPRQLEPVGTTWREKPKREC
jgi:hypothetical protein